MPTNESKKEKHKHESSEEKPKHESKKESIPRTQYAIAITDVHIGYKKADRDAFEEFIFDFLPKQSVEHFVMMGDVLDLWTRDDDKLLKQVYGDLQQLASLKDQGRIGTIDYLIGNHDYIIESHKAKYPVLNSFDFKSPQCTNPQWLILEPPKQKGPKKKTFGFLHGHQLLEGRAGKEYDGTCQFLCTNGDFRGWLSRLLFNIRNWAPIISIALALWFWHVSLHLYALIAGLIAVGFGVVLYRHGPSLEALVQNSYEEQMQVLVGAMRWRDRRRLIHYMMQSPDRRQGMEPLELKAIERAHRRTKGALTDIRPKEAQSALSKSLATTVDESAYAAMVAAEHRVLGHTHKKVDDPKYTNLGSWEKGAQHWYFSISMEGDFRMEEYKREPSLKDKHYH